MNGWAKQLVWPITFADAVIFCLPSINLSKKKISLLNDVNGKFDLLKVMFCHFSIPMFWFSLKMFSFEMQYISTECKRNRRRKRKWFPWLWQSREDIFFSSSVISYGFHVSTTENQWNGICLEKYIIFLENLKVAKSKKRTKNIVKKKKKICVLCSFLSQHLSYYNSLKAM